MSSATENDSPDEWIPLEPRALLRGSVKPGAKFRLLHRPMDIERFLIGNESKAEYYTLLADLAIEFPPVNLITSLLVERLGQQFWLLRRLARAEAARYKTMASGFLVRGSYETDNHRFLERMEKNALRMIKELRSLRKDFATGPKAKQPRAELTPEKVFKEFSHQLGIREWWRDPDEFFRYEVQGDVSPGELE